MVSSRSRPSSRVRRRVEHRRQIKKLFSSSRILFFAGICLVEPAEASSCGPQRLAVKSPPVAQVVCSTPCRHCGVGHACHQVGRPSATTTRGRPRRLFLCANVQVNAPSLADSSDWSGDATESQGHRPRGNSENSFECSGSETAARASELTRVARCTSSRHATRDSEETVSLIELRVAQALFHKSACSS